MRARIPLDVDLEDRLVYGLTPIRLAYAVLAGLGAMAIWSANAWPAAVRAPTALVVLTAGAILAWGTLRGRPADEWVIDSALFLWSTRRLRWHLPKRPTVPQQPEDDFGDGLGEAA
jgi:hypothetical protein